MTIYLFTDNEERVLRSMDAHEGSYLYELASGAQLTPAEAFLAAKRLHDRGCVVFDKRGRFVRLTSEGKAARKYLSRWQPSSRKGRPRHSYVTAGRQAMSDKAMDGTTVAALSAAIDAEILKYA